MESGKSGMLYVCGHPGQGKTAVLNQVLFNHFGNYDMAPYGADSRLFVLKYNAMRFENAV